MRRLRPRRGERRFSCLSPHWHLKQSLQRGSLGASFLPHCQYHPLVPSLQWPGNVKDHAKECQPGTRLLSWNTSWISRQAPQDPSNAACWVQHTVTQKHMWWAITVINFMRLCVPNVRFQADLFVELCQASAWFNQVVLNLPLFTLGEGESRTMSLVQSAELIYPKDFDGLVICFL